MSVTNMTIKKARLPAFLAGFLVSSIFFFSDWISVDIGDFAVNFGAILFGGRDSGIFSFSVGIFFLVLFPVIVFDLLIVHLTGVKGGLTALLFYSALGYFASFLAFLVLSSIAISMFGGF